MTDNNEHNDPEAQDNEFHITEPSEWKEPDVGADLPEEPPEPPSIEQELDPESAKKRSRERIENILGEQRQTPKNRDTQQHTTEPAPSKQTQPVKPDPSRSEHPAPEPQTLNNPTASEQGRGRDSLDELDRRINLAQQTGENSETRDPAPIENNSSDTAEPDNYTDQELVDQILEIHTDISHANEHTGELDQTLNKLEQLLKYHGITPINPGTGDKLDPERHQVIETVDSQYPEGTIVEVVRPGYENSSHVIEEALVRTAGNEE